MLLLPTTPMARDMDTPQTRETFVPTSGPSAEPRTRAAESQETVRERDEKLLRAWQAKDVEAGAALLDLYRPLFYKLCLGRGLSSQEDVQDLYGDVVTDLLTQLPKLYVKTSFASCLHFSFKSAWKRFRSQRRRRRQQVSFEELRPVGSGDRQSPSSLELEEEESQRETLIAAVLECIGRLETLEYDLFKARIFEQKKFAAIARECSLTPGHLRVLYHRTVKKVQQCLQRRGSEFHLAS
jgi:RNA polymerase sigma factor (sigma-70 family)